jgi:hypothetical protein
MCGVHTNATSDGLLVAVLDRRQIDTHYLNAEEHVEISDERYFT